MLGELADNLDAITTISHRFFGRVGGTSPDPWGGLNTQFDAGDSPARVEENLARIRFQIGVRRHGLVAPRQVHGTDVRRVTATDAPDAVASWECDALWTDAPDVAIAVRTADCAPILLSSADGTVVAAVHAGWRGATAGIVGTVVQTLERDAGVKPADLVAAVGPCIGKDVYTVGQEVIDAATAAGADAADVSFTDADGALHFDLRGFVVGQLKAAGVHNVQTVGGCTSDTVYHFSHRTEKGKTGRQMAAIARALSPMRVEGVTDPRAPALGGPGQAHPLIRG